MEWPSWCFHGLLVQVNVMQFEGWWRQRKETINEHLHLPTTSNFDSGKIFIWLLLDLELIPLGQINMDLTTKKILQTLPQKKWRHIDYIFLVSCDPHNSNEGAKNSEHSYLFYIVHNSHDVVALNPCKQTTLTQLLYLVKTMANGFAVISHHMWDLIYCVGWGQPKVKTNKTVSTFNDKYDVSLIKVITFLTLTTKHKMLKCIKKIKI